MKKTIKKMGVYEFRQTLAEALREVQYKDTDIILVSSSARRPIAKLVGLTDKEVEEHK